MDLHTLMAGLLPKPSPDLPNPLISSIRYDSRLVGPGDLYVAVPGTRCDGHDHIPAAILAGAQAIVCDQSWFASQLAPDPSVVWLPVSNPRMALAEVSAAYYGHPGR
ncbi:MAG: UDP-N-acetylmuramyl peptide synthase, partial [Candidatus Melainabacteria bacterium HGW-Melainabacteria-1]